MHIYLIVSFSLSAMTAFNRSKSYIPDKSGRVFPKNPISNALLADWKSDSLMGSYVSSILDNAEYNSSSGIVLPVIFESSTLNAFIASSLWLLIQSLSLTLESVYQRVLHIQLPHFLHFLLFCNHYLVSIF